MKKADFEDIVQTAGMAATPDYNCQLTDALSKQTKTKRTIRLELVRFEQFYNTLFFS